MTLDEQIWRFLPSCNSPKCLDFENHCTVCEGAIIGIKTLIPPTEKPVFTCACGKHQPTPLTEAEQTEMMDFVKWSKGSARRMVDFYKANLSYMPWWRLLKRRRLKQIIAYWETEAAREITDIKVTIN